MIIHRPFVAFSLYPDGWAGCFSSNLGKCAKQNGFFGHQVGDAKWRVDEDQRSDRGKHPL